eukprot:5033139-Lingulodinium_polyedra.AAC.1
MGTRSRRLKRRKFGTGTHRRFSGGTAAAAAPGACAGSAAAGWGAPARQRTMGARVALAAGR